MQNVKFIKRGLQLAMCFYCLSSFTCTWYGSAFHGNYTKSGEVFDKDKLTCASNHFKLGTKLKITNIENGKSVIVRVNDTGAFKDKNIDLSEGAFKRIANLKLGRIEIKVKKV
jgi:rare lipoprotein A